jgi:hypothetical protein
MIWPRRPRSAPRLCLRIDLPSALEPRSSSTNVVKPLSNTAECRPFDHSCVNPSVGSRRIAEARRRSRLKPMANAGTTGRRGDLRAAVIDAAFDQLATGGLAEFSVAKIARQLGVRTAAPYRHFPGRDGVVAAIAVFTARLPPGGRPPARSWRCGTCWSARASAWW